MAETAGPPPCARAAPSPRVMLLSLWVGPGQAWHARLVAPDAAVHEFCSPFELARFLAQLPPRRECAENGLR